MNKKQNICIATLFSVIIIISGIFMSSMGYGLLTFMIVTFLLGSISLLISRSKIPRVMALIFFVVSVIAIVFLEQINDKGLSFIISTIAFELVIFAGFRRIWITFGYYQK